MRELLTTMPDKSSEPTAVGGVSWRSRCGRERGVIELSAERMVAVIAAWVIRGAL
jgi:hypothetical protein